MTDRSIRVALLSMALTLAGACDHDRGRSPTAPPGNNLAIQTLSIVGETRIAGPGGTTQLTAFLTGSDGASEDVTAQCRWEVSPPEVAEVAATGMVRASRYGTATISAFHGSARNLPQVTLRVAPAETFVVQGLVHTTSGMRFQGTRVTIESSAGDFATFTASDGAYSLPFRGNAVLRIDEPGYLPLRQQLSLGSDYRLDLVLEPGDELLSGTYQVTITASSRCELPSAAMQRTFEAIVEELQGQVYVAAQGYQFVGLGGIAGFTGSRTGDQVTFELRDNVFEGDSLVERVEDVGDVCFAGTATGKILGNRISASFDGTIRVDETSYSCTAVDHRLEMTRTSGSG